ncbi:uncharacterized protein LOC127841734 isoform X1 [Dreissena polymorpha]|uniref:Uncharacterized protein n=1 Tax=Dreissena polymorpha TaxID=45954 RepID=A0A9D4IWT5_DREPO|nr:uncharacterized protein LOC127841734 isoform X1 [Dreissena polymorpha]XP_052226732.1 uncharacterized protein LOC127841734 isoform X1 [Dreissena polymorpha]KAH3787699.1 hypothetical protein DPMN_165826 [Dreissena polymorpha]
MANILLVVISIGTIAHAAVAAPLGDFTEDTFAQLIVDGRPVIDLESREESLASIEDLEAFRSRLRGLESIDSLREPIDKLQSMNEYSTPLKRFMCNTHSFAPGCRGKRSQTRSGHNLIRSGLNIGSSAHRQFDINNQPKRFMCNTHSSAPGCRGKRSQTRSGHNLNRSGLNIGSSAQRQFDINNQPVSFRTVLKPFLCPLWGCGKIDQGERSVDSGESQYNSHEVIDAQPVEMYPTASKQYKHGSGAENLDRSDPHISNLVVGLCNNNSFECMWNMRA